MTSVKKKRIANVLWAILITAVVTLLLSTACQSKSGQLKPEKIVILDSEPIEYEHGYKDIRYTKYKVKRIEHGVVTYIYDREKSYETGDTIYHTFYN